MATRTVKARVELDGERQYKQALSELQKGNQVLSSEMKKLQAEYKGNTESTEFLTKKGELLERQLLQQKDKVQTLREALQNAAKQYGESSSKTQEWQIKLNSAEAAQYDLEHAIEENNKALEGEDKAMSGLGDTVGDLASKLGIQLPKGATDALNGIKGFSTGSVAALGAAVGAVTALISGVKKLHQLTLEAAADADNILTESMTTGLSTKTIQQFQYAEKLIDVSYGTITGSLTKLTQSMAKASAGNEELARGFADLGVSIQNSDGSLRSSEAVFYDLIDALGGMSNVTERDAAAMQLLGRSAQELNPLIIKGSGALKELGEEAEATGYVLDEWQVKKLGEVDDAYQRMQLQIDATKKEMAESFAPAAKAAMELFTGLIKTAGEALVDSGLIDGFASLVELLGHLFGAGKKVSDEAVPGMGKSFNLLKEILYPVSMFLANIVDALNVLAGVALPWNWGSGIARTALGWNYGSGSPSASQTVKMRYEGTYGEYQASLAGYNAETGWYSGNYANGQTDYSWADNYQWKDDEDGWNAHGSSNWRGGMTWVGENGPEKVLLPSGTQILNAQDSRNAGGTVFNITIPAKDIKEFNDIVRIAQSARVLARMGG